MRRGPVLIVDDDHAVRELITLVLDGCTVAHASTGAQALQVLAAGPVGAVVLDHRLPDRTGIELLPEIGAAQPGVPVIMMTGYGSERLCAAAFRLGVWDYFPKPMDVLELAQSVRRALAGNGSNGHDAARHENGLGTERHGNGHGAARLEPIEEGSAAPGPTARPPDMAIQKVTQLVQHRYWDRLSLARLARDVGMSKFRLSHRFTQVMGLSFRRYLLTVRLERAKEILAEGQTSITDVAQAVGFGDLPRFDKQFKRYTGLTPSAYRARPPARDSR